jgi:AmpD protein
MGIIFSPDGIKVVWVVLGYHARVSDTSYQRRFIGGWLEGAECRASANCDPRPVGSCPELIVIHNISLPPGEFGGEDIHALFTNTLDTGKHSFFQALSGLRVSAHFLIRRNGAVTQFVDTENRAWHAGQSQWRGRPRCNDYSIGIELEGTDHALYTDEQYDELVPLINLLMLTYPQITSDAIVGHSDIAPERKTDPGPAFDWHRLRLSLNNKP